MIAQQQPALLAPRPLRPAPRLKANRLIESPFLSPEERQALVDASADARTYPPHVDLVREGEGADSLFIVTDGWACRYLTTKEGARGLPAVLVPGDVGNLDSLLFDRLDNGVRTLTQATVTALPRDRALALAAQHPGIARTFTWLAMVENAILSRWTLCLGRRSARERLAHLLCELSVRLGADGKGESSFALPLTQEQLADALGLTSVHVNRTLQQLRNEGVAVLANRTVTLPDIGALRRIGGFDPDYLHVEPAGARQ